MDADLPMGHPAVVFLVAVALVGAGAPQVAGQSSPTDGMATGETAANFSFVAADQDSRVPGAQQASYRGLLTVPREWESVESVSVRGPFGINTSSCSASSVRAAGFDRGGNLSGSGTDESILTYIKDVNFTTFENGSFEYNFEFYTNPVNGSILSFAAGDQVVAAVDGCFTVPTSPGWYRVTAAVNGTAPDGTVRSRTYESNWVAVCDCRSRADARAQIGQTPTPVPTPTPTPSPTSGGPSQGGTGFGIIATVVAAVLVVMLAIRE